MAPSNFYTMDPVEFSFMMWAKQFPESSHQCDLNRFYTFVVTLKKYKCGNSKWLKKDYFIKKCHKYNFFNDVMIDQRYNLLIDLFCFVDAEPVPIYRIERHLSNDDSAEPKFFQKAVIDGKVYQIQITKEEFDKRLIGKRKFKKMISG